MALLQRKGEEREDEFMLFNTANQTRKYVTLGEDFDGGTLLYVHQRGGVTLRGDKYLVYPLGMPLSNALVAEDAQDYPELQRAATFHRNAVAELSKKKEEEAKAPGLQVPNQNGEMPAEPTANVEKPRALEAAGGAKEGSPWVIVPDEVQGQPATTLPDATQGPPATIAPDNTQGPPADAADVTATPAEAAGTSGDVPPADEAGKGEQAEKGQTGSPPSPATKRRPTRNRRPR